MDNDLEIFRRREEKKKKKKKSINPVDYPKHNDDLKHVLLKNGKYRDVVLFEDAVKSFPMIHDELVGK
jgi:hypothetical protein